MRKSSPLPSHDSSAQPRPHFYIPLPKCVRPSLEPAASIRYPPGSLPAPRGYQITRPPFGFSCNLRLGPGSASHLPSSVPPTIGMGPLRTHPPRVRRLPLALPRQFEDTNLLRQSHRVCCLEAGCLSCPGSSPLRAFRSLRYPVRGCRKEEGQRPQVRTHPYTAVTQSFQCTCTSFPQFSRPVDIALSEELKKKQAYARHFSHDQRTR
jgi:hypothetical protein